MTNEIVPLPGTVIHICWAIFAVVWMVTAFSTKRTVRREGIGPRGLMLFVVAAAAVLIWQSRRSRAWDVVLFPPSEPLAIVAAIVCILGLLFTLWARFTLGRNWSGRITLKENHELIERGPYRLVRHPIYTGVLTMALATALSIGTAGAFAGWVLLCIGLSIKAAYEEKLLRSHFGGQYEEYRRRVKRIVPFVY